MYIDVLKYTGTDVTQSSSVLYLKLNSGESEFTPYQVQGTAPWGGQTTAYWRLRERFAVIYGYSLPYQWSNVDFVKSKSSGDGVYIARLQQDQLLNEEYWYRGSGHTATFGTGGGQFDLTTTSNDFIRAYLSTLCDQDDVEKLALSHLQGRLRFSETQAHDEITNQVMSYDGLWDIIYRVSAHFQSMLGKVYTTPLKLGSDADRRRLADYAAKEVLIQIYSRMGLIGSNRGLLELIDGWRKEIQGFLDNPEGLEEEGRRMVGGSFRVERA